MYRVQVEHQGNCSDLSAVAWVIEAGTGIYTKTSCDCGFGYSFFFAIDILAILETSGNGVAWRKISGFTGRHQRWRVVRSRFQTGPWHARWKNHHSFGATRHPIRGYMMNFEPCHAMPIIKFALICSFKSRQHLAFAVWIVSMTCEHSKCLQ